MSNSFTFEKTKKKVIEIIYEKKLVGKKKPKKQANKLIAFQNSKSLAEDEIKKKLGWLYDAF